MVRRGQQKRKAVRDASKAAHEEIESPSGTYRPPPREDCTEKQWDIPSDDPNTVRAKFMIWRHGGALTEFVVVIQVLMSDGWRDVARYDCCHGHCHFHPVTDAEPKTIKPLDDVADVETAFRVVNDMVVDQMRIIRNREGV